MLFSGVLQNGDVIGQFVNKAGSTQDVVRIAKVQGVIVAFVSNNASSNYVIISRETLIAYVALTGTAANRVVLNGIVTQDQLAYIGDNIAIQALSLSGTYSSGTRPLLASEINLTGYVEAEEVGLLLSNPAFVAIYTTLLIAQSYIPASKTEEYKKRVRNIDVKKIMGI